MPEIDDEEILVVANQAIDAAAARVLAMFEQPDSLQVRTKSGPADVVTQADIEGERIVRSVVLDLRPDDSFVGEEGTRVDGTSGVTWILDPVDSTANFAREIPIWSISLAAVVDDEVIAAVVSFPTRSETYSANGQSPVLVNGRPSHRSRADTPASGMLALGWGPSAVGRRHGIVADTLIPRFGKVRSPGSPALGLSWTAIGRFDAAYYEMNFSDWDVRAGAFLCQRAGLRVEERPPALPGACRRLLAAPDVYWDEVKGVLEDTADG